MSNKQKIIVVLLVALILLSVGGIILSTSLPGFKSIIFGGQAKGEDSSGGHIQLSVQEPPITGENE